MNALLIHLNRFTSGFWVHRFLVLPAAVAAIALISFYVHVLHESMARGDALRREQLADSGARLVKVAGGQGSQRRTERPADSQALEIASGR